MYSGWATVVCTIESRAWFDGPCKPGVSIQCYGLFGSLLSFENVATQIAVHLLANFDDVALHDYRQPEQPDDFPFPEHGYLNPNAPVGLFHGIAYKELPKVMSGHRFRIGCLVCDANAMPEDTIAICNQSFDLVVVPSQFCRQVYHRSGLEVPTLVVPHGVSDQFVPRAVEKPKVFTFYNVYSQSRNYRKSSDELIRSFVRAFDRDPGYSLRLRTTLTAQLREQLDRERAWDVVVVDENPLPEEDYARRFSEVHVTVHPSKAEGFGMVPLQSLACETPVIAPNTTGLADYLNDENALFIETKGMVPALHDIGLSAGGRYHGIDEDSLVSRMRDAVEHFDREKQKAVSAGPSIRALYSWSNVLQPLTSVIDHQLNRRGEPVASV